MTTAFAAVKLPDLTPLKIELMGNSAKMRYNQKINT
jgi:hypothetical protein